MTKMDMVWIAAASLLYPETHRSKTLTRAQIEAQVARFFGASITPEMINVHLVSCQGRQADKANARHGGSRNRYLFKTDDGIRPALFGRFRLYKETDVEHDGRDKNGPSYPRSESIHSYYRHLVFWYEQHYFKGLYAVP